MAVAAWISAVALVAVTVLLWLVIHGLRSLLVLIIELQRQNGHLLAELQQIRGSTGAINDKIQY